MKFAIPMAMGKLTSHFGHCREFAFVEAEGDNVKLSEVLEPPPHEPGVLPKWVHEHGANVVIAGGMGKMAQSLFTEQGIKVITGAPVADPVELVKSYLADSLTTGDNQCGHEDGTPCNH